MKRNQFLQRVSLRDDGLFSTNRWGSSYVPVFMWRPTENRRTLQKVR